MIKLKITTLIIDTEDDSAAIYTDSVDSTENYEEVKGLYQNMLRTHIQMTFKSLNNKDNLPMTINDLKRIFPDLIGD